MPTGPGPKYPLKSLTGFDEHDISKHRGPCYSMKFKQKGKVGFTTPGPYSVNQRWTEHGPHKSPAFTMAFRHPPLGKYQ